MTDVSVEARTLAILDALQDEAAAHMYSDDLEKFSRSECTATAFSVRVGCPDGKSQPLFSRQQVAEALSAALSANNQERAEAVSVGVTLESVERALDYLELYNGAGRKADAYLMLEPIAATSTKPADEGAAVKAEPFGYVDKFDVFFRRRPPLLTVTPVYDTPQPPTAEGQTELAEHAIEELMQLGYTVKDGMWFPPEQGRAAAGVVPVTPEFEEAFQLVFDAYNRPGDTFPSYESNLFWVRGKISRAFSLMQRVKYGEKFGVAATQPALPDAGLDSQKGAS